MHNSDGGGYMYGYIIHISYSSMYVLYTIIYVLYASSEKMWYANGRRTKWVGGGIHGKKIKSTKDPYVIRNIDRLRILQMLCVYLASSEAIRKYCTQCAQGDFFFTQLTPFFFC